MDCHSLQLSWLQQNFVLLYPHLAKYDIFTAKDKVHRDDRGLTFAQLPTEAEGESETISQDCFSFANGCYTSSTNTFEDAEPVSMLDMLRDLKPSNEEVLVVPTTNARERHAVHIWAGDQGLLSMATCEESLPHVSAWYCTICRRHGHTHTFYEDDLNPFSPLVCPAGSHFQRLQVVNNAFNAVRVSQSAAVLDSTSGGHRHVSKRKGQSAIALTLLASLPAPKMRLLQ